MGGNGPGPTRKRKEIGNSSGSIVRDACDIKLQTPLAHVRTAQSADLRAGVFLNVEVQLVSEKKTVACKRKNNNEIVGFVLARGASQLIECIEQDNVYTAEITKVDFGQVEVSIRRSA